MAQQTITAANSVYMLGITGLYPTAQQLQGYDTDDAFDTDEVENAEVSKGVDGLISYAWLPTITMQNIVIRPNSPSLQLFEDWLAAENAAREKLTAFATILLPAIGKKYTMSNGVLVKATPIPGVKKVLQPVKYSIAWDKCEPSKI